METTYPTQRSRRNSLTPRPVGASAGARGYLWTVFELDLHEAVDVLQAEAECNGLVSRIGADGVQAILADAFHEFRADCCP